MALRKRRAEKTVLAVTLLVGASGVLGQLLLLRELLVAFFGNELTMGIILGNWLVLEAAGAYLANRVPPGKSIFYYKTGLMLYGLLLPVTIFFARSISHTFFGLLPGEALGLAHLFATSIILLAPVSFIHGSLFTLGCAALKELNREAADNNRAPGRIYLYETLGSLVAGVLFSFLLAPVYHSIEIALALLVIHFLALCFLILTNSKGVIARGKIPAASLFLILAVIASVFFGPLKNSLHELSLTFQWPGQDVIHYENSPFGNIVVTSSKGEYTLYYDGRPTLTTPNPDLAQAADLISLSAGSHSQPKEVLLVGGAGTAIGLLLEHPVEKLTLIELDPRLPSLFMELPFDDIQRELTNSRVEVVAGDARRHLQTEEALYDLILLCFIHPDSLQENRLFTRTFFNLAHSRLAPGGILVFSAPGSALMLTPEVEPLLSSLYSTAKEVFPYVEALPGDNTLFFASEKKLLLGPDLIYARLLERNLTESFITYSYLQNRFDPLIVDPFRARLEEHNALINEDFRPAAFYYSLFHWGSLYSPSIFKILNRLEQATLILTFIFLAGLVFLAQSKVSPLKKPKTLLPFAVFTSGATGMAFDLLILFLFQTFYGYVYQMMGLLVALYMTGVAFGSYLGLKVSNQEELRIISFRKIKAAGTGKTLLKAKQGIDWSEKRGQSLLKVELLTLLLHPALFFLALGFQAYAFKLPDYFSLLVFSSFALICGAALGAHFPIACALAGKQDSGNDDMTPAGKLYAADLLGGWAAGLAISIYMFPLLGLGHTLVLLGLLKGCSLLLVRRAHLSGAL